YRAVTMMAGVQMQPALSPDGRSVAFVSNKDGAYNVYVSVIGGGSVLQVTSGRELKSHPAWSPRGTLLAYAQRNASGLWDVWEVPALGGTPRILLRDSADPTWSPDGNSLAYYRPSSGELWMSSASGEDAFKLADRIRNIDGDPKFSPDGREVAFIDESSGPYGRLEVVNRDKKSVRQLTAIDALALSPCWTPDGKAIYFASGLNGAINIWKIPAQGGALTQVTSGQGDDAELDLSGDGRRLVFSTFRTDSRVAQLDLAAAPGQNPVSLLTTDPSRNQLAPQYSPDGKRLAYFTNLKGVEVEQVWTAQADGSQAAPLISDNASNIFPRWSADARQIYFTTDTPVDRQARQTRVAPSDGGPAQGVAKQFDLNFDVGAGNRLLYVTAGGVVQSFDPATRRTALMLPLSPGLRPLRARWSPDANSFAFMAEAASDGDSHAGLWLKTGEAPPRQIFRGWVRDFERGPRGLI
ncbi:MAG: LpqB family beta-propeller domain-containing protein, partial [Terriglobales bacterium]